MPSKRPPPSVRIASFHTSLPWGKDKTQPGDLANPPRSLHTYPATRLLGLFCFLGSKGGPSGLQRGSFLMAYSIWGKLSTTPDLGPIRIHLYAGLPFCYHSFWGGAVVDCPSS